jgi:phosphate transport system permease protein
MPALTDPPQRPSEAEPTPARFRVSRRTLAFDSFMTWFIKLGGVLVITAVAGIFIFILFQIIPLFKGARVGELKVVAADAKSYRMLGVDEWSELPVLVEPNGTLTFIDTTGARPPQVVAPDFGEARQITAVAYRQEGQKVIVGTADGRFAIVNLNYSMTYEGGRQQVIQAAKADKFYSVAPENARVLQIAYGDSGDAKLVAAVCEVDGKTELHAATLTEKRSLFGKGEIEVGDAFNLTAELRGAPAHIRVNSSADGVLVTTDAGEVDYFFRSGDEMVLRQKFEPFADRQDRRIAAIDYVLGDVSVVVSSPTGENRVFSLFVPKGGNDRWWGQTKEFPKLPGGPTYFASSLRNKTFLIGTDSFASLRYSTTESIRWEKKLPFQVAHAVIAGKNDRLLFLDTAGKLHLYYLDDPHPEASLKALFGKLWYEGASEPKYEWQSTGGTDDFEPKLSLVPLIIGTLKGTLYAMLFALPIAVLAALYSALFLQPKFKRVVKPVMEIMASLPSVVLGFLAALWLAPLLETRVPSVITIVLLIPASALLFGWFWAGLRYEVRRRIPPGYEFLVFVPILFVVGWMGWNLGPVVERVFFTVTDPDTGVKVADFRQWWPQVTGADYQQRNSLVVGFIMGFAVIPIIFTITEDALSNVPSALTTGSLALGASRWQTAVNVVMPTASAGIFSAIMIGLGRAIGETMIVVMATGNTPIMNFNIFSGMRTLSANIAVELPEAPHHGTLYRTLFLGAMMLFVMTFIVNTIAEIMRQRLREKYKTV